MKNKTMICPACDSNDIVSLGHEYSSSHIFYICNDCGFESTAESFEREGYSDAINSINNELKIKS